MEETEIPQKKAIKKIKINSMYLCQIDFCSPELDLWMYLFYKNNIEPLDLDWTEEQLLGAENLIYYAFFNANGEIIMGFSGSPEQGIFNLQDFFYQPSCQISQLQCKELLESQSIQWNSNSLHTYSQKAYKQWMS